MKYLLEKRGVHLYRNCYFFFLFCLRLCLYLPFLFSSKRSASFFGTCLWMMEVFRTYILHIPSLRSPMGTANSNQSGGRGIVVRLKTYSSPPPAKLPVSWFEYFITANKARSPRGEGSLLCRREECVHGLSAAKQSMYIADRHSARNVACVYLLNITVIDIIIIDNLS